MPFRITPNTPLGVPEFAALYAAEGQDPYAAASNIHVNYPTEAKSLLDRRWKATGINMAPERYFATIANRPQSAIPDRNPTFATEAERNIAIATGAYDPAYASPMQRANVAALEMIGQKDRQAIRAGADRAYPMVTGGPITVANQLAGDTKGLAKKILARRQGIDLEAEFASGKPEGDTNWLEADPRFRTPLQPYISKSGFGALEGTSLPTRLDTDIYYDPDFQEQMAQDPEAAAYAYQRLTGRALTGDLDETLATRKTQVDVGRKYATAALTQGAQRDPITGKWKVWNMAEPEDTMGLGQVRPTRQLIEASPEQQEWLNTHYETIIGKRLPQRSVAEEKYRADLENLMANDEGFQEIVKAEEQIEGRKLTEKELAFLAKRRLQQPVRGPWEQGGRNLLEGAMKAAVPPSDQEILDALKYLAPQSLQNFVPSF